MLPFGLSASLAACLVGALVAFAGGAAATRAYYLPKLELERAHVERLAADVTAQNDALEALREQADRRAAEAKAAIFAAAADAKKHEANAQQILARQRPADTTECQAVVEVLREGLQ